MQVIRLKQVTLPVIKLVKDVPLYMWVKGPMHVGKKIDDQKEAATIMEIVDCETGQLGLVICGAVMAKELNEGYPGDSYVGKFFEVTPTRVPEKRYNIYSICEIADPRDDRQAAPESTKANVVSIAQDAEVAAEDAQEADSKAQSRRRAR